MRGHSWQRAFVLPPASFSKVPGGHGSLASQYGWPRRSWYLPEGQGLQAAWLFFVENVCAAQSLHVPVLESTNVPGVHEPQ